MHATGLEKPDDSDAKTKFFAAEALRGDGGLVFDAHGNRFAGKRCTRLGNLAVEMVSFERDDAASPMFLAADQEWAAKFTESCGCHHRGLYDDDALDVQRSIAVLTKSIFD